MPYSVKSAWHPVVYLVMTGDVDLVTFVLTGQTNFATTLDLFLPTSGGGLFYKAMVERCDGPEVTKN